MGHRVEISGEKIIITFEGLEKIEAIKSRLEFNLKNIVYVSTETRKWIEGLRIGGTGLPGVIKEGRYVFRDGSKAFFAMRNPDECVTIQFKNEFYDYLIFDVDDKDKVANEIRKAANIKGER
ncbi:MAG: hypothetical protein ACP5RS_03370 [Thermoplasmata archaeon]